MRQDRSAAIAKSPREMTKAEDQSNHCHTTSRMLYETKSHPHGRTDITVISPVTWFIYLIMFYPYVEQLPLQYIS